MSSVRALKSENNDIRAGGPGRLWLILLSAGMVLADTSILNVVAPLIGHELRATIVELQLAVAGYQIAYASTLVLGGWFGDRWGRHAMLRWGLVLFAVASLSCGAAPDMPVLIMARIVQGLAAGLVFPQVLGILRTQADPEERGRSLGLLAMVMGLATVAGPVVAGILVQVAPHAVSWRLIFLINLPICLIVWRFAISGREGRGQTVEGRLDILGAVWTAIAIAAIAVPLTLGRALHWPVWSLLLAAAALPLAVGYCFYEQRLYAAGESCIMPIGAFGKPQLLRTVLGYFLFFAASTCFFLYFSILVQRGAGATPFITGLTLAPYGVGAAVSSPLSARFVRRWSAGLIVASGAVVCVVGTLITALLVWLLPAHTLAVGVAPALVVTGFGLGFVVTPILGVVLSLASPADAGAVGGALTTGQQIGGAMGIVIFGLFLPVRLQTSVPYDALSHAFVHGLFYEAALFATVALLFMTVRSRETAS